MSSLLREKSDVTALALPLLFGLTILLSAFAMFVVEPLTAKLLLPGLGGGPSIWNTCVVFFQITLLLGYLYAHVSTTRLSLTYQLVVHLIVIALPFLFFPITAPDAVPAGDHPFLWLFSRLIIQIGPFFFAISTTAPLMQRWYSQARAPQSGDPYFLFAASNFGALIGLLAYPSYLETSYSLAEQSQILQCLYGVFAVCITVCGSIIYRQRAKEASNLDSGPEARSSDRNINDSSVELPDLPVLSSTDAVQILLLTFTPSALVLALNTYVTTDLWSVPLFWIIPLFMYLSSFIIAFSRFGSPAAMVSRKIAPFMVLSVVILLTSLNAADIVLEQTSIVALTTIHIVTLFVVSLACHGSVAQKRPHPSRLTIYFLLVSAGGVLGSVFSTLAAPVLFKSSEEYPLLMIAAGMSLAAGPFPARSASTINNKYMMPVVALIACLASGSFHFFFLSHARQAAESGGPILLIDTGLEILFRFVVPLTIAFFLTHTRAQFRLCIALLGLLAVSTYSFMDQTVVMRERNFFGRLSIVVDPVVNRIEMWNGDSIHGAESLNPVKRGQPYFYCYDDGPIGLVAQTVCKEAWKAADPVSREAHREQGASAESINRFHHAIGEKKREAPLSPMAVMGLGSGIAAALAKPGQTLDFYEINPAVVSAADNPFYFTYLYKARKRKVKLHLTCGDGRLEIKKAPYHFYKLIISDTYSGNAIPAHMITREAIATFLDKLAPDGVLAFNITSAHYDLKPVIASLANHFKLSALTAKEFDRSPEGIRHQFYIDWAILCRSPELSSQFQSQGWKPLPADPKFRLWTDDYSNPLGVLLQ